MSSNHFTGAANRADSGQTRADWVKPTVSRIVAGSAEAVQRDGDPDGGNPGTSRS